MLRRWSLRWVGGGWEEGQAAWQHWVRLDWTLASGSGEDDQVQTGSQTAQGSGKIGEGNLGPGWCGIQG